MALIWLLVALLIIFAIVGGVAVNSWLFLILLIAVVLVLVGALQPQQATAVFNRLVVGPAMLAATGERHYDQVGQEVSTLFSFNHGRERGTTEFDENNYREETYRSGVGSYYGEGGAGWRDW